jgi:hypothetical protein
MPSHRQGRRSRGFSSPFFTSHSHRSHEAYAFRDPFELFDAIFRDFDDIFSAHARHSASSSTPFSPFRPHRSRSLFDDPFFASAPTFPAFPPPIPSIPPMFMAPFPLTFEDTGGSRRQGAQTTSYVSHTVNGATRSTHTRCDKDVSNLNLSAGILFHDLSRGMSMLLTSILMVVKSTQSITSNSLFVGS